MNQPSQRALQYSLQQDAGLTFAALHRTKPGFVMPNAWDAGSAIILANEGFNAIATTSAGIAFSLGKQDYDVRDSRLGVARDVMFERLHQIVGAVRVPVNGDLEAGYGDSPAAVAQTIRMAIDAGLAGGNIEDKIPGENALYPEALAVERIVAARDTIDASKRAFVLTARTDALLVQGAAPVATCIRRGNLFREAGADCVFTPGAPDLSAIARLVREIDAPLNIVVGLGNAKADTRAILGAGIQRISLGGSIARAALGFVRAAARELRDRGTIEFAAAQFSGADLNSLLDQASNVGRASLSSHSDQARE
jgi:2-methylisocitrate lyase-like PEP mutase family enzyme